MAGLRVCGRLTETGAVATLTLERGRILVDQNDVRDPDLGGPDCWLAPGFLDLMLNGYAGLDFNTGGADPALLARDLVDLVRRVARAGTALFCPTIYTASLESMRGSLASLAAAIEREPVLARAVVGIHVEGPYISPETGPVGAHPPQFVRKPDWDEFRSLQHAAGGRIRLLTLAPELDGALPFIERLAAAGVVVAIGHTAADGECIRAAVRAGAVLSTHLGNGAHAVLPRHPNYLWDQLAEDGLVASIIADGHHLPPSVVKCIARVKGPGRLILVSDAGAVGGMPPGLYHDGRVEVLPSGKVVLAGTPYLAGAGHLLDTCVANAIDFADLTIAEAASCAAAVPARLLGLRRKGSLDLGSDADLTLFRLPDDGPLEIAATICAGEVVYKLS